LGQDTSTRSALGYWPPEFTIMAISSQKTPSVFQRYNVVTEEELQGVKWKTEESRGVHIGVHQP
jgi:hypothetical protein